MLTISIVQLVKRVRTDRGGGSRLNTLELINRRKNSAKI